MAQRAHRFTTLHSAAEAGRGLWDHRVHPLLQQGPLEHVSRRTVWNKVTDRGARSISGQVPAPPSPGALPFPVFVSPGSWLHGLGPLQKRLLVICTATRSRLRHKSVAPQAVVVKGREELSYQEVSSSFLSIKKLLTQLGSLCHRFLCINYTFLRCRHEKNDVLTFHRWTLRINQFQQERLSLQISFRYPLRHHAIRLAKGEVKYM